jgi:hypothetical protein
VDLIVEWNEGVSAPKDPEWTVKIFDIIRSLVKNAWMQGFLENEDKKSRS